MLQIILSIFLILTTFITKANQVFVPENNIKVVTPFISYFIDSTDVLTIDQIKQKKLSGYIPSKETYIDFGYTKHPIWIYFEISTNTRIAPFLLFDNNNGIDSITMYTGGEQHTLYLQHHGEQVLKKDKNFYTILPVFMLPYSNGRKQVWLKITNYNKTTSFSLEAGSAANVFRKIQNITLIMAGFFFLMVIVLVSNIILYITFKTGLVFSFGLFNLATLLFICSASGLNIFFPEQYAYHITQYHPLLLCLLMISGIYMSINMLNIRKYYPRAFTYLVIIACICALAMLVNLLGMTLTASIISAPLGLIIIPVYIVLSWKEYKRGESHAIYFLIGWVIYYILLVCIILYGYKIISTRQYSNYLIPAISVVDFFFFSATIIFKINSYRKEKVKAEKEKSNLIEKQNINLEKNVEERTRELKKLYNEIAVQNEELFKQKEQITELNNNLEKTVEKRTDELQETMASLQQRNQDLEQFSYIISHNLRGPVATILGLTNLFNKQNIQDPINTEVILNIDKVVFSLDHIIRDLNYIISLREQVNEEKKNINLSSLTNLCVELLDTDIKSSSASIITDFSEVENINSIPAYLQNIFYNLISNSIKYQKENEPAIVNIKSSLQADAVLLSFSDNGIGIDLENIDINKIFRLYQRFNQNREGRGIGLFLVKSQVEALKGTIEVKSKLKKGTEFLIKLPINKDLQK